MFGLSAVLTFSLTKHERDMISWAVTATEDFSQVDSNGTIFSVEKVEVASSKNELNNFRYVNEHLVSNVAYSSMYIREHNSKEQVYFKNIETETRNKTVVKNGDYVMLNNMLNDDGTYYSDKLGATKQEAILVSFGSYFYTNSDRTNYAIRGENTPTGAINNILISAKLNGEPYQDDKGNSLLPAVRQFNSLRSQDFVFVIPQNPELEGHWEFEMSYYTAEGVSVEGLTFEFYLIFESSYTMSDNIKTNPSSEQEIYTAYPTFNNASKNNSVYTYKMGMETQLPLLTYDYTRYYMEYTHVANGVTKHYEYKFDSANKQLTIYENGVDTGKPKKLNAYNKENLTNYIVFAFTEMGDYDIEFTYMYKNQPIPENRGMDNFWYTLHIQGFEAKYSKYKYEEAQLRHITFIDATEVGSDISNVKADLIVPNGLELSKVKASDVALTDKLQVVYSLEKNVTGNIKKAGIVTAKEDASIDINEYKEFRSVSSSTVTDENYSNYYVLDDSSFVKATSYVATGVTYYEYSTTDISLSSVNTALKTKGNSTTLVKSLLHLLKDRNKYVKTNQGSIWIDSANGYDLDNSFYFHNSSKEFTYEDLFEKEKASGVNASNYTTFKVWNGSEFATPSAPYDENTTYYTGQYVSTKKGYTNTTEFNLPGYYLVFMAVDVKLDGEFRVDDGDFYQVLAFQYTTDTVNLTVTDKDGKNVGAGKYTNKQVEVHWEEPGIFDREIEAYYYVGKSHEISELKSGTRRNLTKDTLIGDITKNIWNTYLIEIVSEDQASTYRTFTIDTQDIKGVQVYFVDKNGNYIKQSAITNQTSTIYWDDKESGANITASYSFTPFVEDEDKDKNGVYDKQPVASISTGTAEWFTNGYVLGSKAEGLEIHKTFGIGSSLESNQRFSQQGIYVFTITDEAGNSCKYMFVIDKSPNYFYVKAGSYLEDGSYVASDDDGFYTKTSQLFSDDIEYKVGTHKAIFLGANNDFLDILGSDNYYKYDINHDSAISGLFNKVSEDGSDKHYLIVKNLSVGSFTSEGKQESQSSIDNIGYNANNRPVKNTAANEGTSTIRRLYLIGENQKDTLKSESANLKYNYFESSAYMLVEINTDNSRGMVFTKDSNPFVSVPTVSEDGTVSGANRLYTGKAIAGAHATNDSHVIFTWLEGVDETKVSKVSYQYFPFDSNLTYNSNEYYFYKDGETPVSLYENNSYKQGAMARNGRAFAVINESNGKTREGLYVVTREYEQSTGLGRDNQTVYYWFIVDRTGVIDAAAGKEIKINLLENETPYNQFNQVNSEPEEFDFKVSDEKTIHIEYNVQLTTNKVPVTAYIPIGKYFNGTKGSDYYAGRLKFTVYYNDIYQQITTEEKPYKLFEINEYTNDANGGYWDINTGSYVINFWAKNSNGDYAFLSAEQKTLFRASGNNWMYLQGDYVIVITDMVEGENGNHEKVVAFRVKSSKPTATIYETTEQDSTTPFDKIELNSTEMTANQEYIKLEIPEYNVNSLNASIDTSYLKVERSDWGTAYIFNNYGLEPGVNKIGSANNTTFPIRKDNDGNYIIFLNTKDAEGNLLYPELNITYTITVRYRLWNNATQGDKFKDCYYYYSLKNENGNVVRKDEDYYYQTFKVVLDRQAPKTNITELINNDNLVSEHNAKYEVDSFNEDFTYGESGEILYFTNRNTAYYNNIKSSDKLYTFEVKQDTKFYLEDVEKVFVKYIGTTNLSSLEMNLPVIRESGYNVYTRESNLNEITYTTLIQNVTGRTEDGVYEIVEFDKAGNMTQYLIEYNLENKVTLSIEKDSDGTLTSLSPNSDVGFFELKNLKIIANEYFYSIQLLKNGTSVLFELSDFTYNLEKLENKIKKEINTFGQYKIIIKSRHSVDEYVLNYYDKNSVVDLNLQDMVEKDVSGWKINLKGANVDAKTPIYLTNIQISKNGESAIVYTSTDGQIYLKDGYEVNTLLDTEAEAVYSIIATDSLERSYKYKFKSGNESYVFYNITFGANENAYVIAEGSEFISFQQANIKFDNKTFVAAIKYSVNDGEFEDISTFPHEYKTVEICSKEDNEDVTTITLHPYFSSDGVGALIKFVVELQHNGYTEQKYTVTLDTRTTSVQLKDRNTNRNEEMAFAANRDDIYSTNFDAWASGRKMLIWSNLQSPDFKYSYKLFETVKDIDENDVNKPPIDLNNKNGIYAVESSSANGSVYRFVIYVYDQLGNELGKKIYTFALKAKYNKIYYVQTLDGEMIASENSWFDKTDLTMRLTDALGTQFDVNKIKGKTPLYISNEDLRVDLINNDGLELKRYSTQNNEFTIYEIDAQTYQLYVGVLIVQKTDNLINSLSIVKTPKNTLASSTTTRIWSADSKPISVQGTLIRALPDDKIELSLNEISSTGIFTKNLIEVEIRYGIEFVDRITIKSGENITFNGNGTYSFKVKDLAGNTHYFATSTGGGDYYVQATLLREVEITINGNAPVDKALYNGEVDFRVVSSSGNYEHGSIKWHAYRNGELLTSSYDNNNESNFKFTRPGSYRLVVEANPKGDKETIISKELLFTIVNEKEAKKSFDLTSLVDYEITEILDNEGNDITNIFMIMLDSSTQGRLVTYDMLLDNEDMDIGSGKQTFTVTYKVESGIYPTTIETFQFTLNNETPFIESSIEPGDTTTKGFTVSLNPAVIYSQIGEAVLCVNGVEIVTINEFSTSDYIHKEFSEKVDGAGDYYITLESLSGDLILAFKIEIKEPLNTSSIIIIIVAAAVVIAVIVTIIVLRTKMRIR